MRCSVAVLQFQNSPSSCREYANIINYIYNIILNSLGDLARVFLELQHCNAATLSCLFLMSFPDFG